MRPNSDTERDDEDGDANPRRRIDSPPQRFLHRKGRDSYDNITRRGYPLEWDDTGDYPPTPTQQSGSEDGRDDNRHDNRRRNDDYQRHDDYRPHNADNRINVIVPGPGSRSYRVPTLPDPTGYYYCTLQLGCSIVVAICSVHLEVN